MFSLTDTVSKKSFDLNWKKTNLQITIIQTYKEIKWYFEHTSQQKVDKRDSSSSEHVGHNTQLIATQVCYPHRPLPQSPANKFKQTLINNINFKFLNTKAYSMTWSLTLWNGICPKWDHPYSRCVRVPSRSRSGGCQLVASVGKEMVKPRLLHYHTALRRGPHGHFSFHNIH